MLFQAVRCRSARSVMAASSSHRLGDQGVLLSPVLPLSLWSMLFTRIQGYLMDQLLDLDLAGAGFNRSRQCVK